MAYKKVETATGYRKIFTCEKEDEIESIRIIFERKNKYLRKKQNQEVIISKGDYDMRIIVEDKPMWGKPIVED